MASTIIRTPSHKQQFVIPDVTRAQKPKVFGLRAVDPGSGATCSVHVSLDPGQLNLSAKSKIWDKLASGMTGLWVCDLEPFHFLPSRETALDSSFARIFNGKPPTLFLNAL
jgi:hypothetical protein